MTAARYQLPRRFSERSFVECLKKSYRVARAPAASRQETYLDTFDWRLFKEGLALSAGDGRLVLSRRATGETVASAEAPARPRFAWDLPPGALRRRLEAVVEERALLPLFEVARRTAPMRILNRSEKTIARIETEEIRFVNDAAVKPFSRHLRLRPVRGYDKQAKELARWLAETGLSEAGDDLFSRLAEAADKQPGDYTSKLDFTLDPRMSAYDALIRICRFLAGVIRRNEEGVRRDLDTEFLHDWRVATRRTRAGLGQLRKVFPKRVNSRYRAEFARFGEKTNRLRDLDVYLLNVEAYRDLVPEEIRGDIEPLFDRVREERRRELEKVRRWMRSDAYESALAGWERFLDRPFSEADARADSRTPILELANRTIRARYQAVVESGGEAASTPDDDKLHMLRIEGKKLRYLLEFFSSLYPSDDVGKLVKQLKLLQDNLGRHQDIAVQQEGLRAFADDLGGAEGGAERTAVAVGALVGALENEKQELRNAFAGVFGHFASKQNARLFGKLFAATPDVDSETPGKRLSARRKTGDDTEE
jgi:CHAD domain-containing protein